MASTLYVNIRSKNVWVRVSQPKSRLDLWIPWYVVNTLYQRRNCLIVFIPSKISLDTLIPFPSRLPCYSFALFIQVSVLFACILSSKRFSAEIILWYALGVTFVFLMHLSHTWLCHIWFFGCECESNKMPHGAWKSEKVCVYAVCVVRRSTFRSNAIKTVTIIQQFALWLLFVRKALHLINILARCSFVSDTDLHLPLNGMAKRNSLTSSLSISCSNTYKNPWRIRNFDEVNWTRVADSIFVIFRFSSTLFSQIGYLDVVIPPDFIAEDTSSDVIVNSFSCISLHLNCTIC